MMSFCWLLYASGTSASTISISTFGDLGEGDNSSWSGGATSPQGAVYGVPAFANTILKIWPHNRTVSTFPLSASPPQNKVSSSGASTKSGYIARWKWDGGVLSPQGNIYGMPFGSSEVLRIDPARDTATTFGETGAQPGHQSWAGGILSPQGSIYAVPWDAEHVLVVDPATDTVRNATGLGLLHSGLYGANTREKWCGGVLTTQGSILMVPHGADEVLLIDPATDTHRFFGGAAISAAAAAWDATGTARHRKWCGGVALARGARGGGSVVYAIPFDAHHILRLDVTGSGVAAQVEVTLFGDVGSERAKWIGGVLMGDVVYGIPAESPHVLKLHPANGTGAGSDGAHDEVRFATAPQLSAPARAQPRSNIARWQFGVLSRGGGEVIGIPFDSATVLMIRDVRAAPRLGGRAVSTGTIAFISIMSTVIVAAGVLLVVVRSGRRLPCSCNIDTSSDSEDGSSDSDEDSPSSVVAVAGPVARSPMHPNGDSASSDEASAGAEAGAGTAELELATRGTAMRDAAIV